MKTKIFLFSMLASLSIFVFSTATWADGGKNRRTGYKKPSHYKASRHCNSNHHPGHWQRAKHNRAKKDHYCHRCYHRANHHYHRIHHRHNPHYKDHSRYNRPYYKRHHEYRRPVIKLHRPQHCRPVYSHHNKKRSIVASASHHGWKIKIISRD